MANFSKISALFDSTVNNILLRSAEAIANEARANAPTERIKANIEISAIQETAQGKQIQVSVPLSKAPEARAYELGSGIHGAEGHTYPIDARNVPNLVFFWQKANRWFVGPHVDHPGVAPKPYLFPAAQKHRRSIRGLIDRGILKVVSAAIRVGFTDK